MNSIKSITIGLCLGIAAVGVTATSALSVPITVPSLAVGSQYRLAFVTSTTRNALSTEIKDYNKFVDGVAEAVPELAELYQDWRAIGSTATVSARDNTSTDPSPAGPNGVPIFLLNDTKLVDDYDDLWDDSIDIDFDRNENGDAVSQTLVWTGTRRTGLGFSNRELGSSITQVGLTSGLFSPFDWVQFSFRDPAMKLEFPLYAISEILTVAAIPAIPEPAPLSLLVLGLIGLAVTRRKRAGNGVLRSHCNTI